METNDPVNNPSHYTFGKHEVIDVLYDWQLEYPLDNVVKYVARAGKKDESKELEDLEKARFYLDYLIGQKGGYRWNPKATENSSEETSKKSKPNFVEGVGISDAALLAGFEDGLVGTDSNNDQRQYFADLSFATMYDEGRLMGERIAMAKEVFGEKGED